MYENSYITGFIRYSLYYYPSSLQQQIQQITVRVDKTCESDMKSALTTTKERHSRVPHAIRCKVQGYKDKCTQLETVVRS